MALVDIRIKDGVKVTATTIGKYFALHPAVMVDTETGELSLDTEAWYLQHLPSGTLALHLHQTDPLEFPGEPRALGKVKVEEFVAWLEKRVDCSASELDLSRLTEDDRRLLTDFSHDPNYVKFPKDPQPSVEAGPVSFGPDGFTVSI